ncbi:hypothetical protein [Streptomyces sp. NPDC054838]
MPFYQTPNLFQTGKSTPGLLAQAPFSICDRGSGRRQVSLKPKEA